MLFFVWLFWFFLWFLFEDLLVVFIIVVWVWVWVWIGVGFGVGGGIGDWWEVVYGGLGFVCIGVIKGVIVCIGIWCCWCWVIDCEVLFFV